MILIIFCQKFIVLKYLKKRKSIGINMYKISKWMLFEDMIYCGLEAVQISNLYSEIRNINIEHKVIGQTLYHSFIINKHYKI